MDGNEILLLGLGIQSPWQLVDQRLDVDKQPHELHLQVGSVSAGANPRIIAAEVGR